MTESELIQKVRKGDFKAFQEWIDNHSGQIERFVFQNGFSLETAYEITLDLFIALRNEIESYDDEKSLILVLYKIIIEKITGIHLLTSIRDDVFSFKEDADLHSKIIKLDNKYRVPFILFQFQRLSYEEISLILEIQLTEVETNIQTAKNVLEEEHIDKQLELLRKSYDRLPVQFNAQQIMGGMANSEVVPKKSKKKPVIFAFSALLIITIGILSVFLQLPRTVQYANSDSNMNDLLEKYQEERSNRQEILKLTDDRFNQLRFVRAADEKMFKLKNGLSEPQKRQEMEAEVKKIINDSKLPFEMLEDIANNPLDQDEKASISFLSLYRDKLNDLIKVYDRVLWDYREAIENYDVNPPERKLEIMMLSRTSFPEELQNVLNTMRDNSIKICMNSSTGKMNSCYYKSTIHQKIQNHTQYNAWGYVNLIVNEHHAYDYSNEEDVQRVVHDLIGMEHTLVHGRQDTELYTVLETRFSKFLSEIVKGSSKPNKDKSVWAMLSFHGDATPMGYLIRPIIEEMDATNWSSSVSWNQFNNDKITEALKLARDGKLEEIMYGKKPVVDDHVVAFPDNLFSIEVEGLYIKFKQTNDKSLFKGLSPIYIVGVFDYANEMEDPETMFYLFHDSMAQYSESGIVDIETYVENWRKGFSLFSEAKRIVFSANSIARNVDDYLVDVKITYNDDRERYVGAILDKSEKWHMRETWMRQLPSYDVEHENEINNFFMENTSASYYYFSEYGHGNLQGMRAIDIIGLYFYSAELGDFDTQYELFYQGENSQVPDKKQYIKEKSERPQLNMVDMFKAISFKGQEQDDNGNWPGVATLTINLDENPGEEPTKSFKMMWSNDGWRVVYNPME